MISPADTAVLARADDQKVTEKRAQQQVVKNLRALGFFVTSFSQAQKAQMTAGVPDLFAAHRRWSIQLWIEMKAPHRRRHMNGGLSEAQMIWHVMARQSGVDVITAYGWADVSKALCERGVPIG